MNNFEPNFGARKQASHLTYFVAVVVARVVVRVVIRVALLSYLNKLRDGIKMRCKRPFGCNELARMNDDDLTQNPIRVKEIYYYSSHCIVEIYI